MFTKSRLRLCLFLGLLGFINVAAAEKADPQPVIDAQLPQKLVDAVLEALPSSLQQSVAGVLWESAYRSADLPEKTQRTLLAGHLKDRLYSYTYDCETKAFLSGLAESAICRSLITPRQQLEAFQLLPQQVLFELLYDLGALHNAESHRCERVLKQGFQTVLVYSTDEKLLNLSRESSRELDRYKKYAELDFLDEKTGKNFEALLPYCDKRFVRNAFSCALPYEVKYKILDESWNKHPERINPGFAELLGLKQEDYERTIVYELMNSTYNFLARLDDVDAAWHALFTLLSELKMLYANVTKLRLKHLTAYSLQFKTIFENRLRVIPQYVEDTDVFHTLLEYLDANLFATIELKKTRC